MQYGSLRVSLAVYVMQVSLALVCHVPFSVVLATRSSPRLHGVPVTCTFVRVQRKDILEDPARYFLFSKKFFSGGPTILLAQNFILIYLLKMFRMLGSIFIKFRINCRYSVCSRYLPNKRGAAFCESSRENLYKIKSRICACELMKQLIIIRVTVAIGGPRLVCFNGTYNLHSGLSIRQTETGTHTDTQLKETTKIKIN